MNIDTMAFIFRCVVGVVIIYLILRALKRERDANKA